MATSRSSAVSPGDVTIASQYNNLRLDAFSPAMIAATIAFSNGLANVIVIGGVTYTATRNFRNEISSITDGTTTVTIARTTSGFISSYA